MSVLWHPFCYGLQSLFVLSALRPDRRWVLIGYSANNAQHDGCYGSLRDVSEIGNMSGQRAFGQPVTTFGGLYTTSFLQERKR
jgi:hypothetical protein